MQMSLDDNKKLFSIIVLSDSDAALQHHLRHREVQMTKTVLLVCVSYVACFLPSVVLMVVDPMPPCRGYPGTSVVYKMNFKICYIC